MSRPNANSVTDEEWAEWEAEREQRITAEQRSFERQHELQVIRACQPSRDELLDRLRYALRCNAALAVERDRLALIVLEYDPCALRPPDADAAR